ncbi:hypothetical protein K435DRAFT_759638 [Dendrothele bispora CBS 962.96]|uniref:Carrier domain-containing protein n=1 Tax=Dendrothele bispora (strain CBS 962.96) TaxID=1314807 RepID=A0A4S8LPE2_DENBC|nr:hypothetical protein K435DRAFT_759638 [Dendrothele bispora CBS 962.96]
MQIPNLLKSLSQVDEHDIEYVYRVTPYQQNVLSTGPPHSSSFNLYHLSLPSGSDISRLKNAWNYAVEVIPMLRTGFYLSQDVHALAVIYKSNTEVRPKWVESELDLPNALDVVDGEIPIVIGTSQDGCNVQLYIHRALCDHASAKILIQFLYQAYSEQPTPCTSPNFTQILETMVSCSPVMVREGTEKPDSVWPRPKSVTAQELHDTVSSSTRSLVRLSHTKFVGQLTVFRTALAATMILHSGTASQYFIENVSKRLSLPSHHQEVIGPCMTSTLVKFNSSHSESLSDVLAGHTGSTTGVELLPLTDKEEILHYQSVVCLTIRSSFDRVDDADIPGWKLMEGTMGSSCPINVDVLPTQAGLTEVQFKYRPALLKEAIDIDAFADHFTSALELLSDITPPSSMKDLFRGISDAHRDKILSLSTNQSSGDHQPSKLLAHERFEAIVKSSPSAVALNFEGSSTMSYSELDALSTALALELRGKGVKSNDMVPILFNVSFDMMIAILAVMKAGGAYVPLAPDYPSARWERVLRSTSANLLICGQDIVSQPDMSAVQDALPTLTVLSYSSQSFTPSTTTSLSPSTVSEGDLAYVFFTSGSTGTPKGVGVEHRNLRAFLNSGKGNAMTTPGMRKLLFASYTFDVSVGDIFSTLTSGGTLGLVRREALLSDLPHWLDVMKPTHVGVTPSVGRHIPTNGLPHLQYVLLNGETLPVELALRLRKTRQVHNIMGPTEATIDATEFVIPQSSSDDNPFGERVPIGRPIDQNRIYILRPGTTELAVQGEVGEICIGGPQVARGYIGDTALSNAKFVHDPFSSGMSGTMFRTADLGRWNHLGQLDHLGRMDGQVKLRGLRIETGEIEYIVQKSNSDLHAVHADLVHVGDEQLLVVVFTLKSLAGKVPNDQWVIPSSVDEVSHTIDLANTACDTHLPLYMKPTFWFCVTNFPATTSGKTDRSALRQKIADHITKMSVTPNGASIRHPNTPSETLVANIAANVLNMPTDNVDLNASLLALGGNSLQAMSLTAQLRDQGFDVSILRVLDHRVTLGDLAALPMVNGAQVNGKKKHTTYKPFVLAPPHWEEAARRLDLNVQDIEDVYPVDVTARDWVRLALDHGGRGLLTQWRYDLSGDLDAERFVWSWEQLRLREPILRTVFLDVDLTSEQILKLKNNVPFANSLGLTAAVLCPDVEGRGPFFDTSTAANSEEADALINKMFGEHGLELGVVAIRNLLVYNEEDRTWLFASSRHHALHDIRSLGMQHEDLSLLYQEGEAAFPVIENKRSVEGSFGAFMQLAHAPERQSSGRTFWKEYLADTSLPIWPPVSEVPLSFYKDFTTYGVHVVPWVGSLTSLAQKLGVTKGALARAAYAIALAEKEKRDKTLIYEIVDGLSGLQLDPWGFCTHYQYTKVDTLPPGSEKSKLERYSRVVQDCHQNYVKTLPHSASGCDMAAEIIGADSEPGQHFATALLNIFDMTDPRASAQSSADGRPGPFSLLQRFIATEQSTFVGVDLPLNVVCRIMDQATIIICLYDLSFLTKEEIEAFIQRHVDVLDTLKEILN